MKINYHYVITIVLVFIVSVFVSYDVYLGRVDATKNFIELDAKTLSDYCSEGRQADITGRNILLGGRILRIENFDKIQYIVLDAGSRSPIYCEMINYPEIPKETSGNVEISCRYGKTTQDYILMKDCGIANTGY